MKQYFTYDDPPIDPPLRITLKETHLTLPLDSKPHLQNILALETRRLLTAYYQITLVIPHQIM